MIILTNTVSINYFSFLTFLFKKKINFFLISQSDYFDYELLEKKMTSL
jgi:hypothetical protein